MGKGKKRKTGDGIDAKEEGTSTAAEESVDDIFAELHASRKAKKEYKPKKKEEKTVKPSARRQEDAAEDESWRARDRPPTPPGKQSDADLRVHRFTAEGLPVYKYFHLGMEQNDGGTPLCPFDCDCCF